MTYNTQELARADRKRTFTTRCAACDTPIYLDPGYCTLCTWDEEPACSQPGTSHQPHPNDAAFAVAGVNGRAFLRLVQGAKE